MINRQTWLLYYEQQSYATVVLKTSIFIHFFILFQIPEKIDQYIWKIPEKYIHIVCPRTSGDGRRTPVKLILWNVLMGRRDPQLCTPWRSMDLTILFYPQTLHVFMVKHLFKITKSKFLICCNMDIFSQITYLTFWIVLSIEEFSVHPHHKDMSDRDSSVHLSRRPWFVSYAMYF